MTWPCGAVGSELNCWYRDHEFDLGPILSWRLIMKYFLSSFSLFSDSGRDIVSYKQKRVHKVLPSLSLPQKSVVRLTDRLYMDITVDWNFTPKENDPKIAPGVSHIYIVWSEIHQNTGVTVV